MVELARLEVKAGELPKALANCDAVVKEKPDCAAAHAQRAEVLLRLDGDHVHEAGRELDRYFQAGGKETSEILRARGLIYMGFAKRVEAVDAFSRALVLRPDAETHSLRGWAYLAQEAARPALADFDVALGLEKTHAEALRGRATALVLLGRTAEAEAAAESALQGTKRTPDALFQVSCVYGLALEKGGAGNTLRYQERALDLLRETLAILGDDDTRRAFWQKKVEPAPALLSMRGSRGMQELAALYGKRR
jgi:tetratricopeptide (TPR) repeat protein